LRRIDREIERTIDARIGGCTVGYTGWSQEYRHIRQKDTQGGHGQANAAEHKTEG
jgi:hypothetical protein